MRDRSDRSYNPDDGSGPSASNGIQLQPPPQFFPAGDGAPAQPVLTYRQVEQIVESASVELVLPDADFSVGPYAHLNEWDMNAVGQNLWLWLDGGTPAPVSRSVEAGGGARW